MPDLPIFTVVVATYGRGELIQTTLESVAAQSLTDFEVLVVSDGPAATGLAGVVESLGERFHLLENEPRARSQSGPNNAGWSEARGRYVAYLGHDDLWHPEHLAHLAATFADHPEASFVVSGCLYFGPLGASESHTWVTGIFDSSDRNVPREHFFPPSSFGHLRELPPEVPRWQSAEESTEPVDIRFLKSAEAAGLRFASTRVVTVFKFASALRYLSYLSPDDWEQREVLTRMHDLAAFERETEQLVDRARREGRFMPLRYELGEVLPPGEHLQRVEQSRGLDGTQPPVLDHAAWLEPGDDPRGFDWHPAGEDESGQPRWRWSGPNDHPRLRIPFVAAERVRFTVYLGRFPGDQLPQADVLVNRLPTPSTLDRSRGAFALTFTAPLRGDRASVVEFRLPRARGTDREVEDPTRRGFCLLGTRLEPASEVAAADPPEQVLLAIEALERAEPRATVFGADILLSRAEPAEADESSTRRRKKKNNNVR